MIREIGIHRGVFKKLDWRSPDVMAEIYGTMGEFGPMADLAFEAHIKRLAHLREFFKNENGTRMKSILSCERLWYGLFDER